MAVKVGGKRQNTEKFNYFKPTMLELVRES